MNDGDIQRLRTLSEVAAAGDGHRPPPCPICDLAQLSEKAADALERIFDGAAAALPQDAGELLNLIREIESET